MTHRPSIPLLILTLLVAFCSQSFAEKAPKRRWTLDAGVWVSNLKERSNAPSQFTSEVSETSPVVRVRARYALGKFFSFEPALFTLVPWRGNRDGSGKVFTSDLGLHILLPVFKFLDFRLGPGIYWELHTSSEKEVVLNNGLSTSSFYTPSSISNVFLLTTEAGIQLRFSERLSINLDCVVLRTASSSKRRINGMLTLGWSL